MSETELASQLESLREQQRAVNAVLRAVARSEGLQPVLDQIVESATRLCAGDNGRLFLLKDGLMHAVANHGLAEEYDYDRQHPHPVDRTTLAGRAAVTREAVHIPDIDLDPEYSYAGPAPYRAAVSVPILHEEELIGVIGVVRMAPDPFSDAEIELVRTFADQAAIAIANARLLDAVERQRTELARFVSPQVADLLSNDDGERLLAGHRAYISVFFCDLRGFTAFAETAAPEELFELLREYHALLGDLIARHEGTLEHFAGDGVMVFFNDPIPVERPAVKAVRMALDLQQAFAPISQAWERRGHAVALGVGIAQGEATLGVIGFEQRWEYAAIGAIPNLAARLCAQAKGGEILIDAVTYADVSDVVLAEPIGPQSLRGFTQPMPAFRLTGLRK